MKRFIMTLAIVFSLAIIAPSAAFAETVTQDTAQYDVPAGWAVKDGGAANSKAFAHDLGVLIVSTTVPAMEAEMALEGLKITLEAVGVSDFWVSKKEDKEAAKEAINQKGLPFVLHRGSAKFDGKKIDLDIMMYLLPDGKAVIFASAGDRSSLKALEADIFSIHESVRPAAAAK